MIADLLAMLAEGPVTLRLPSVDHARQAGVTLVPALAAEGCAVRVSTAANLVFLTRKGLTGPNR